jgi:hypothetical protein
MKDFNLHGFDLELIMKESKEKEIEESIDYLKYVLHKWEMNPPRLDPNGTLIPPFEERVQKEIEYRMINIENKTRSGEDEKQINKKEEKNKITTDELTKGYIKTCRKLNSAEPTNDQLFDITEIKKSIWYSKLQKSSFWNFLKEELVHSINQAKTDKMRDFWIAVKVNAEHQYEDLVLKEYRQKEK